MNLKLQRHFDQLQGETKSLLKEVSRLSSASYHLQPGDGKWSVSQILTHILTAERLSLNYLKKKSLGFSSLANSGILEELKFLLLVISQRIPMRYKAPRLVVEHTPDALSYGELIRQWEVVRAEMIDFLEQISDDDIRKKVYKHPRVGMLNVVHGIRFLREHIIHHRPQVKRIVANIKAR
jgi:hypothetical protein